MQWKTDANANNTFPPAKMMYEIRSHVVTGDPLKMPGVNGYTFQLFTCDWITRELRWMLMQGVNTIFDAKHPGEVFPRSPESLAALFFGELLWRRF